MSSWCPCRYTPGHPRDHSPFAHHGPSSPLLFLFSYCLLPFCTRHGLGGRACRIFFLGSDESAQLVDYSSMLSTGHHISHVQKLGTRFGSFVSVRFADVVLQCHTNLLVFQSQWLIDQRKHEPCEPRVTTGPRTTGI